MLAASMEDRRALVRRGRKPLVGYVSQRNTLSVSDAGGIVRVAISMRVRLLIGALATLFGPGLALALVAAPDRFFRLPLPIRAVVVLAIAGMIFLLLRTLFRNPRFELAKDGTITVHHPSRRITRGEIRGVDIEEDIYSNPPKVYVTNAVLVLRLADEDVRLCASPDTKLISSLAKRVTDRIHANESRQVNR